MICYEKLTFLSFFFVSLNVYSWSDEAINLDHNYTRGRGVLVGVLDSAARCLDKELVGRRTNRLSAFLVWIASPRLRTMI